MRTQHFLRVLVPASLLLAPLLAAGDAPARQEEGEPFTKVETRYLPLPQPMAVETPGLLDPAQRVEVVFPEKGDRINLPIQIDGERVPSAALNGDELWVDLDGDSEKEKGEVFLRSPQGFGPVRCEFSFHDGTKTRYEFILVPAGAPNRLRLVRACAKTAAIEGLQVTILDDDCNGRFDGYGSDSLLVEGHPPSLLSRVICVRGKLYELVAHPAGNTIEYRSYPGPTGIVDVLARHKPAQKGVSTHTFIIGGTRGYFLAFDDRFPRMAVPEDVYSLRFGLLLRSRERVAVRKGEWPSFKVKAGGIAEPAWGGPIKAGFSLTQDGRRLTVDNVTFSGEAGEIYVPLSFDIIPVRAFLAQITKDTRTRLETAIPQGTQRFDVGADGRLLPLSFEPPVSGEERVIIEYVSGILGRIMHEERITFVKAKGGGGKELSKP